MILLLKPEHFSSPLSGPSYYFRIKLSDVGIVHTIGKNNTSM